MIGLALNRLQKSKRASAPTLPEGMRVYAIGDVHGRLDLLRELADKISGDLHSASASQINAIFLGDYVDRGPQSAAVIEELAQGVFPVPVVALRGNHEDILLRFLEDESVLDSWRKFGGLETLHSYGVSVADPIRGGGYKAARDAFRQAIPESHVQFLKNTSPSVSFGDYFFCHAGVKPGVPLELQSTQDLLWIRDEFLEYPGAFGKVVVHGHTPTPVPEQRFNRINIDTGAYATSKLTALVLEGDQRYFLSTGSE